MTCVHPLGHKGQPFSVGDPSLQNANVRCLVFDTTPRAVGAPSDCKFSNMVQNGAQCCNARQELTGHNEASGPSVPLDAF